MVNELFAKSVDEHTRNLILEKFGNNNWEELAAKLESFDASMIGSTLPAVGSEISVKYKVDVDANFVNTPWQVLGYNGSIPEYVKYKNGNNRIFVRSVEENQTSKNYQLLKSSFAGSPIYSRSADGTYSSVSGKTVADVSLQKFTYGTTNTAYGTTATEHGSYSVPISITVSGTTYTFAGYNMTLIPKYLLPVKTSGKLLYCQTFDYGRSFSHNSCQNDWSTSMTRSWLNDSWEIIQDRCAGQEWKYHTFYDSGSNVYTGAIKGMIDRFSTRSNSFFAHIMPTVNRIWTFKCDNSTDGDRSDYRYRKDKSGIIIKSDSAEYNITKANANGLKYLDSNQCEHCIDKFWLLGVGHVNYNSDYFKFNSSYDTCVFSSIFKSLDVDDTFATVSNSSRIKYIMNENGTGGTLALNWRLYSAKFDTSYEDPGDSVSSVSENGLVGSSAAYSNEVTSTPACTIC